MSIYRIIEGNQEIKELGDYRSVHYIECNQCEKISPFTVRLDDSISVVFMSEIISIKMEKE